MCSALEFRAFHASIVGQNCPDVKNSPGDVEQLLELRWTAKGPPKQKRPSRLAAFSRGANAVSAADSPQGSDPALTPLLPRRHRNFDVRRRRREFRHTHRGARRARVGEERHVDRVHPGK